VTDNRKKNPVRKIDPEVAYEVQARDWYCIFTLLDSWTQKYCKWSGNIEEIHHCYFWGSRQFDEWRNDADRLVWVCAWCHDHIHSRWWKDYREHCIAYLNP
jgi:hypothetical protein